MAIRIASTEIEAINNQCQRLEAQLQHQRERVEKLIDLLKRISLKIRYADEGSDRLIAEIDPQINIEIDEVIIGKTILEEPEAIEKQIEQYKRKYQPKPLITIGEAAANAMVQEFSDNLNAILRSVVEECCEANCLCCAETGNAYKLLDGTNPEGFQYHNEELMIPCQSWKIRNHFAWLDK